MKKKWNLSLNILEIESLEKAIKNTIENMILFRKDFDFEDQRHLHSILQKIREQDGKILKPKQAEDNK